MHSYFSKSNAHIAIKCLLIIGFLSSVTPVFCQGTSWPPSEWKDSVYYKRSRIGRLSAPNRTGLIILKNGDTLRDCYFRPWRTYYEVLKFGAEKSIQIQNDDISYARENIPWIDKTYAEYYKIPHLLYLWRIIEKKGGIAVYDLPRYGRFNSFGEEMILVKNNKVTKIYGGLSSMFQSDANLLVLAFINKHYDQHFKETDFASDIEMIRYILNEENKR